jgi:hypothetical protein
LRLVRLLRRLLVLVLLQAKAGLLLVLLVLVLVLVVLVLVVAVALGRRRLTCLGRSVIGCGRGRGLLGSGRCRRCQGLRLGGSGQRAEEQRVQTFSIRLL